MNLGASARAARGGFSLVELLVAVAIAACLITAAVMIFQNFASHGGARTSYATVSLGAARANFYGGAETTIDVYVAPSYGRAARAEAVREQFLADLQRASAVYCLGRAGLNTIRPASISVPAGFRGDSLDTPDAFRALIDPSGAVFAAYRGASPATNASIYLLEPSESASSLAVLAVYDVDLTPTTSPAGTYASVRRYVAGTLADSCYYDVFYPASGGTLAFNPLVVCFERRARAVVGEGATERFKVATQRPFYFVWWPDPASFQLEAFAGSGGPYGDLDPRSAYAAMGGRTAFFMVVPMFPAL